ncbi:MAG: haloacid dehalogenase [Caldisphaera sp.]|jgi:translin|nr:MAG: haloacid dehalogenase [Caldisphaera sp.]PMP92019.1 MAG: haloacid dehalogenase [Caldisphaera sp.]
MDVQKRLEEIINSIDLYLKELDLVREQVVKISREVIRNSGYSITEIHKGNIEEAIKYLDLCKSNNNKLLELVKNYPELAYSGLAYNAISEYVEAEVLVNIIQGKDIPGYKELNVYPIAYIQGLGDVVGELRRYALEAIRKNNFSKAWESLKLMESIYLEIRGLDYPDAILPGVRHKADVARALVDETKAMLIDLQSREDLKEYLEKLERGKKNDRK